MEIQVTRIHTIILFALLFIVVGWAAPSFYATYAPQDHYIQVHSFEANDATVGQQQHIACFDRTIKRDATGVAFTELYLVDSNGNRIEVLSRSKERFFQKGRTTIQVEIELPNNIKEGTYYYERAYSMTLASGRVERTFVYESDNFNITQNGNHASAC